MQAAMLVLALCRPAHAVRPPAATLEPAAIWMRVFREGVPGYEYIETDENGGALYVNASSGNMLVESGDIKKGLVRDLLRELENADTFDVALEKPRGQFMFMRGSVYEITASHKGELLTARVPESNLTTGFKLAFGETRQAVVKLPRMKGVYRFITASMHKKETMFIPDAKPDRRGETVLLEISDMETIAPLNRALLKPHRLIPIESKKQYDQLAEFMAVHSVANEENVYNFDTLRGRWRLDIINPGAGGELSPKNKNAAGGRKPRGKKLISK